MLSLFKPLKTKDKKRLGAINALPDAFATFTGNAGTSKIKRTNTSLGSFELHFFYRGKNSIVPMTACNTGEAIVFSVGNYSVVISEPFTAETLQPVIKMALDSQNEK